MAEKGEEVARLPGHVVYYNRWVNFENKEIKSTFECIPHEEVAKLQEGATVWIDVEQRTGKIYGYNRAQVTSVTDYGDRISVSYKGPRIHGGSTIPKRNRWHYIHRCTDEGRLMELIRSSPLALSLNTEGHLSEESRRYLKDIGADTA